MLVIERILQLLAGDALRPEELAEAMEQLPHPLLAKPDDLLFRRTASVMVVIRRAASSRAMACTSGSLMFMPMAAAR